MSIYVMSAVWRNGPQKQGHLLVMLALADYANDDGECWPAIASIASKARMTERGVQKIVRQLEDDGWLKIVTGNGRGGCNRYTINPERRSVNTVQGERSSGFSDEETPNKDAKTPNKDAETLNGGSPEPSRTTIEPPVEKKGRDEIAAVLCKFASPSAVASFIAYRKGKRDPLTLTAAKRLAGSLQEILNAGFDPSDALGLAEERGWKSVTPAWYFKDRKDRSDTNDNRNPGPRQSSHVRQNRIDPALANIARLTGLDRASGNGGG